MTIQTTEFQGPGLALAPVQYLAPEHVDPTGGRLVSWAASLVAAKQLGDALCATTFAPASFRGKPEDAAAAILHGDEVGLSPMQALQSIYVISGKPAMYARAMVAVVLAAGHEVWTVSKTDAQVTVAGRRRGSSHVIEETWTTARAAKAGYTNNKKYASDPQAMLYARAASDVCRQVAPDALAGLAYSAEELELSEPEPTTTVTRSPRKTTAKRAPTPPEPDLPVAGVLERDDSVAGAGEADDSTTPPGAEQSEVPATGPSEGQNRLMHRMFHDLGIEDRDERLEFTSAIVGRVLSSSTELTRADASRLIDHMARELGEVAPDAEEQS